MTRIYVGNLDFNTEARRVRRLFEAHGSVKEVKIVKDWETGHSRGFAFVDMADTGDAQEAIEDLNGTELDGRRLTIRPAPSVPPVGFDSLGL